MAREEDFELVRRLRSRDPEIVEAAFEALYRKYRNHVYNLSFGILNDEALALDASQETFLVILRKSRRFKFQSAFSSWLYRVTVNQCIDLRRKRARRSQLSMSEPHVAVWVENEDLLRGETAPGPEESARRKELAAELRRAIANLNPRLAAVVVLRYMEGLGYEEIAESLDMPLGTVKSRLNRAHAALEEALGPKLDEFL
ncbi:MAG: RNA polymerase sigma factor [Planctomycetota bacterium]